MPMPVVSSPEQNRGSQRCFCASVHRSTRYGATTSLWMPRQDATPALSLHISSANTVLKR